MANEKRLIWDVDMKTAFREWFDQEGFRTMNQVIDDIPTVDAVEVVRCKDCKKWEYDENFSGWCTEWRRRTHGDHFCSYGERREGE